MNYTALDISVFPPKKKHSPVVAAITVGLFTILLIMVVIYAYFEIQKATFNAPPKTTPTPTILSPTVSPPAQTVNTFYRLPELTNEEKNSGTMQYSVNIGFTNKVQISNSKGDITYPTGKSLPGIRTLFHGGPVIEVILDLNDTYTITFTQETLPTYVSISYGTGTADTTYMRLNYPSIEYEPETQGQLTLSPDGVYALKIKRATETDYSKEIPALGYNPNRKPDISPPLITVENTKNPDGTKQYTIKVQDDKVGTLKAFYAKRDKITQNYVDYYEYSGPVIVKDDDSIAAYAIDAAGNRSIIIIE